MGPPHKLEMNEYKPFPLLTSIHPSTCGWNEGNCIHGRLNLNVRHQLNLHVWPVEAAVAQPLLRRWRARRLLVSQSLSKIQDLGTAVDVQSGGRAREFSCIFTELDR